MEVSHEVAKEFPKRRIGSVFLLFAPSREAANLSFLFDDGKEISAGGGDAVETLATISPKTKRKASIFSFK